MTQRHVFDHALSQRGDALIGHGILLSEPRLLTLDLQTGRTVPLPRSRQSKAPPCVQRSTARAVSFLDPKETFQPIARHHEASTCSPFARKGWTKIRRRPS